MKLYRKGDDRDRLVAAAVLGRDHSRMFKEGKNSELLPMPRRKVISSSYSIPIHHTSLLSYIWLADLHCSESRAVDASGCGAE